MGSCRGSVLTCALFGSQTEASNPLACSMRMTCYVELSKWGSQLELNEGPLSTKLFVFVLLLPRGLDLERLELSSKIFK